MADIQSSEDRRELKLDEPGLGITEVFIACCGQLVPKLVARRTPVKFRGNSGGANRSFPRLQKRIFQSSEKKKKMSRMHTAVQQTVSPGIPPDRRLDFLGTIHNSM